MTDQSTGQERPARLSERRYAEIKRWSRDDEYRRAKGLKGHALRAIQQLVDELDATRQERDAWKARAERYQAALRIIHRDEGAVCDSYALCEHLSCASSYAAWAFADHAVSHPSHVEACSLCQALAEPRPPAEPFDLDALMDVVDDVMAEEGADEARVSPQPPTAERHAYAQACRLPRHECTCMHLIDGRWCGKSRYDPIHDQSQPPAAPTADHPWFAWLPPTASVHRQCCDRPQSEHPPGAILGVILPRGLDGKGS
jgi:hypothetical protein